MFFLKWHRKISGLIIGVVTILSIASIIVYQCISPEVQDTFLFLLVVLSGWTSGAALFVSVWLFNQYQETIENPLEDLTDKTNVLVDDLDEGFLEEFIDSLIQAEKKFADLPEEKQKQVVKMIDKYSDSFMRRIEEMPEKPPKKQINEAEEEQL